MPTGGPPNPGTSQKEAACRIGGEGPRSLSLRELLVGMGERILQNADGRKPRPDPRGPFSEHRSVVSVGRQEEVVHALGMA